MIEPQNESIFKVDHRHSTKNDLYYVSTFVQKKLELLHDTFYVIET